MCVSEINLCPDENSLKDYNGTISITNGGRTCQRWSSNTPHAHSYTSPDFPGDASIESAENYCRGIDGAVPFCLTNDPHVRGQHCDEQICGGNWPRGESSAQVNMKFQLLIDLGIVKISGNFKT